MATWLITAALSTAIVGFVWLIVLAFRGIRRGVTNTGPATSTDGASWMYFGSSSHSSGHHGHDEHGHDSGGSEGAGHGGCDAGSSDGGGCGGGDGGGGGGD